MRISELYDNLLSLAIVNLSWLLYLECLHLCLDRYETVITENPATVPVGKKRKRHQTKTPQKTEKNTIDESKVDSTSQKEDTSSSETHDKSASGLYLRHLISKYHVSLFEKYKNDKRMSSTVRKTSWKVMIAREPEPHDSLLNKFISGLQNQNILEEYEAQLFDISSKNQYLSYDMAKFTESIQPSYEQQVAAAIHELFSGQEKEAFEKMYTDVYRKAFPAAELLGESRVLISNIEEKMTSNGELMKQSEI